MKIPTFLFQYFMFLVLGICILGLIIYTWDLSPLGLDARIKRLEEKGKL